MPRPNTQIFLKVSNTGAQVSWEGEISRWHTGALLDGMREDYSRNQE